VISTWAAFFFGGWFAVDADAAELGRSDAMRRGIALWAFALTIGLFLITANVRGAVELARTLMVPPGARRGVPPAYGIGAAWATFGTVLLALGSAVAGAIVGTATARRRQARRRLKEPRRSEEPTATVP
jgi:hypothetical protein